MTDSHGTTRWLRVGALGVCLALGVAAGAAMWRHPLSQSADEHVSMGIHPGDRTAPTATMPAPPETALTLTPEMLTRSGIRTVPATKGIATRRLHIPGIVQPNGYKTVTVTSLVPGRITQVRAELGQRVTVGDVLASIYSPELAGAQTAYVAARAELTAHDQRQGRAQRLYAAGAVSRQELDMLEAEGTRMAAMVENARARLVLLGMTDDRIQRLTSPTNVVAAFDVQAPMAGVVTKRNANTGLNIDPATPLFTLVDLGTVWVIADLYERDFAKVRVGSPATVTAASYPGLTLKGQVGYIDPQVQEETRTAKLRVEIPNPRAQLRLGMYVDVGVAEESTSAVVLVPKTAVQVVGAQSVVYVASTGMRGRFVERKVEVGDTSGDQVSVLRGLRPGEQVVTDGAFFLRAERERTGER